MAEITIRVSDKVIKIVIAALAAVLLIWGLTQIESSGVLHSKYEIRMFTPQVNGIGKGASVRLDGMPVGKVSMVILAGASENPDRRIEVRLRIEKRFQDLIRTDSSASFMSTSVLGDRFVNIQRGFSGQPIQDGQEIQALKEITLGPLDLLNALAKAANCKKDEETSDGNKPKAGIGTGNNRK